jgi:hypothetical protein
MATKNKTRTVALDAPSARVQEMIRVAETFDFEEGIPKLVRGHMLVFCHHRVYQDSIYVQDDGKWAWFESDGEPGEHGAGITSLWRHLTELKASEEVAS